MRNATSNEIAAWLQKTDIHGGDPRFMETQVALRPAPVGGVGSIEWDSHLVTAIEDRGYCVVVYHVALDDLPAEAAQALRFHKEEQC